MPAPDPSDAAGAQMTQPDTGTEPPRTATFNLLFVCTGNTCRSPLAEGIARAEIARRGWRNVEVASAGLSARAGDSDTGGRSHGRRSSRHSARGKSLKRV